MDSLIEAIANALTGHERLGDSWPAVLGSIALSFGFIAFGIWYFMLR